MSNELSVIENDRLRECERVIERGLHSFVEVGTALMEVRESKLYRRDFSTFEIYCSEKWGISRTYAFRIIGAAQVTNNLLPIGNILPTNEAQARPLMLLQPEQQIEAWQSAVELAGEGRQPTAKEVEYVVKEMTWKESPPIPSGVFRIIYADPPWQFNNSGFDQSAEAHYPTMPTVEIAKMKIPKSDNSVCFMWATNAMLEDALLVMRSWGFEYKSNIVLSMPFVNAKTLNIQTVGDAIWYRTSCGTPVIQI